MNWHFIEAKLITMIAPLCVIATVYHVTYKSVRTKRKDAIIPASSNEKGGAYLRTAVLWSVIGIFIGSQFSNNSDEYMLLGFILTAPVSVIALLSYYDKNDKLTLKQRVEEKRRINREEGIRERENYGREFIG